MTLATKITLARIFLIIPTVVLYIVGMLEETVYLPLLIVSCALFAILCSTDFVDGHIARKTNTVSALGKFLDPLADKIVIVVMLFLIVYFRDFELFPYDGLVIALLGGLILTRSRGRGFQRAGARRGHLRQGEDRSPRRRRGVPHPCGCERGHHVDGRDRLLSRRRAHRYLGAVLTVFSGVRYLVKNKHVLADTVKDGGSESAGAAVAETADAAPSADANEAEK